MGNKASKRSGSSGRQKNKISSHDKVILDLKVQRDKLQQYQKRMAVVMDKENELARSSIKEGRKDKAILILKKKKYQEKMLDQVDQQLLNLEQLTSSIEFALVEQKVINGIKEGNQVLARLNKEMSIENVEKLMSETADAIAYQNEISSLLSGQFDDKDEKDLLDELDQLGLTKMESSLPNVPSTQLLEDRESAEKSTSTTLQEKPGVVTDRERPNKMPVAELN